MGPAMSWLCLTSWGWIPSLLTLGRTILRDDLHPLSPQQNGLPVADGGTCSLMLNAPWFLTSLTWFLRSPHRWPLEPNPWLGLALGRNQTPALPLIVSISVNSEYPIHPFAVDAAFPPSFRLHLRLPLLGPPRECEDRSPPGGCGLRLTPVCKARAAPADSARSSRPQGALWGGAAASPSVHRAWAGPAGRRGARVGELPPQGRCRGQPGRLAWP